MVSGNGTCEHNCIRGWVAEPIPRYFSDVYFGARNGWALCPNSDHLPPGRAPRITADRHIERLAEKANSDR